MKRFCDLAKGPVTQCGGERPRLRESMRQIRSLLRRWRGALSRERSYFSGLTLTAGQQRIRMWICW